MELSKILSMVDHTLLKPESTWAQIQEICDDAMAYKTATVCIPASYVARCKAYMTEKGSGVGVCTVIGFPTGYSTTASKVFEAADAVKNGADEVVYPDRDLAEKLAVKLNSKKVFDFIELNDEYSIFEIAVPLAWYGKKLIDLNPRKKYGLNLLTIKKGEAVVPSLDANYVFQKDEHMLVFGKTEDILAFTKKW